jgi:hypothetical protein
MASMPKKLHNALLLQKYQKTELMDSKELQAFLWIQGLHGYKLAHACEHLKKTRFGPLYPLAAFAEKASFHGLLAFLAMRYLSSLAFHQNTWLSNPSAVAASLFSRTCKLHVIDAETATITGKPRHKQTPTPTHTKSEKRKQHAALLEFKDHEGFLLGCVSRCGCVCSFLCLHRSWEMSRASSCNRRKETTRVEGTGVAISGRKIGLHGCCCM